MAAPKGGGFIAVNLFVEAGVLGNVALYPIERSEL
jgi:hypothetical protein